jgi:hypothetical protein
MARLGKSTAPLWLGLGIALGFLVHPAFHSKTPKPDVVSPETSATLPRNPQPSEPPQPTAPAQHALAGVTQLATQVASGNVPEILRLIANLGPGEFEQALTLINTVRAEDKAFVRNLSRRWAEVDPLGAAQFLQKTRDMEFARTLLSDAAPKLVQQDPQGALDFIGSTKNPVFKLFNAHAILGELAKVDPNRATGYLAAHPEFLRYDDIYRQVARSYAQVSPAAAVEWAESLQSRKVKREALQYAWTAWAENDPLGAAAAFQQSKGSMADHDLASALSRSWSAADPKGARAWIESLTDRRAQDAAWAQFRIPLDKFTADEALELFNSVSSGRGQTAIALNVTSQMADRDLPTALAWADRLPSGAARTQALRTLLDRWAPDDPAAAVAYAAAQPEDTSRTELLRRALGVWGLQDPEAAIAWAKERPAGNERDEIASDALRAVREFDPARALSWLELIDNPNIRNQATTEIIGEIAQSDGPAAAQLAAKVPGEAQPQAFYSVIRGWAFSDHEGAGNWINTLPAGAPRDSAINAYVSVIDGMDAGLATHWATAIEQPALRDQVTESAFSRWLHEKPEPAQQWLANAEEPLRSKLQRVLEQHQARVQR